MALLLLCLVASLPVATLSQKQPTAHISLGKVFGTFCPGTTRAVRFLGIPYASPPLGLQRWSAPQPYTVPYPQNGLKAYKSSAWCIQPVQRTTGWRTQVSEDCLYLNIWAPAHAIWATNTSNLPVRFFIHGGSFLTGSGGSNTVDGCQIVQDADVVAVTINYRLGVLGFLALPEFRYQKGYPNTTAGTTGNWGVLDQRMALQWVHNNIAGFGGDPSRVLLYGESAGARSVFIHLMLSRSAGLFSSAICQSGAPDYGTVIPIKDAYTFGEMLKGELNCNVPQSKACLLNKTSAEISAAVASLPPAAWFVPTQDGAEFTSSPLQIMESGSLNYVPSILGVNLNEGRLFVDSTLKALLGSPMSTLLKLTESDFLESVRKSPERLGPPPIIIPPQFKAQVLKRYHARNFRGSWFHAAAAITTDSLYWCPTARAARYFSRKTSVWIYTYTQAPSSGCWLENAFGIPHAAVNHYVIRAGFNSTHTTEMPAVFRMPYATTDVNTKRCKFTAAEMQMSSFMSGVWNSMATSQHPLPPITQTLTAPQFQTLKWPEYQDKDKQAMSINYDTPGPFTWDISAQCKIWDDINKYIWETGSLFT